MSRPMIKFVNASTGEEVLREMNDAEFAKHQEVIAEWEAKKNAAAEAQAKRQTLLDKLGITEEEAKLLLS